MIESYLSDKNNLPLRWIGEDNNDPRPSWLPNEVEPLELVMRTNDVLATVEALVAGLGIGRLPRIIGDAESRLVEYKVNCPLPQAPTYLLTHTDMRRVNRIRVFNEFIVDRTRDKLRGGNHPIYNRSKK